MVIKIWFINGLVVKKLRKKGKKFGNKIIYYQQFRNEQR